MMTHSDVKGSISFLIVLSVRDFCLYVRSYEQIGWPSYSIQYLYFMKTACYTTDDREDVLGAWIIDIDMILKQKLQNPHEFRNSSLSV